VEAPEEVNGWEVLEWGGDEEEQLEATPLLLLFITRKPRVE